MHIPYPCIDEMIKVITIYRVFSVQGLWSAYHQFRLVSLTGFPVIRGSSKKIIIEDKLQDIFASIDNMTMYGYYWADHNHKLKRV